MHDVTNRLAAVVATVTALGTLAAAPAAVPAERSTVDRLDERSGLQVHLVYVLPGDGADRRLDTDGTIAASLESAQRWLAGQADQRRLRVDTAAGEPDISFLRLSKSNAEIAMSGAFVREEIAGGLEDAGLDAPDKLYLAYYDGLSTFACGGASWPPALPGNLGALYLRGKVPNASPCEENPFAAASQPPGYWELSALHEVLHTIGIVAACAPHHVRSGHVGDSPNDLMYAGDAPWTPTTLDVGHDDYYRHATPACLDLATSGWLTAPPVVPLPPVIEPPGAGTAPLPVTPAAPPAPAAPGSAGGGQAVPLPPSGGGPGAGSGPRKVRPIRVIAAASPRRARRSPYRFTIRGRAVLPRASQAAGCRGVASATVRLRQGVVRSRGRLTRRCSFRLVLALPAVRMRPGERLVVRITVSGALLRATSAPPITVRVG